MKPTNNNYNILIVDNSSMIVERLCGLLRELGNVKAVSKAYSYEEALETLSAGNFDLVLLDTQLQDKSGFELLAYIKSNFPEVKTIMFTNQTSCFYQEKGERIGTDHFIDKSSEFEKVIEIIQDYSPGYELN
ncbi:MAG: response regulator [Ferruginibacter sp.]